jgi:hypothetical protein
MLKVIIEKFNPNEHLIRYLEDLFKSNEESKADEKIRLLAENFDKVAPFFQSVKDHNEKVISKLYSTNSLRELLA